MLSINAYVFAGNFGIDDHLDIVVGYRKGNKKGFRGKTVNAEIVLQIVYESAYVIWLEDDIVYYKVLGEEGK